MRWEEDAIDGDIPFSVNCIRSGSVFKEPLYEAVSIEVTRILFGLCYGKFDLYNNIHLFSRSFKY